MAGSFIGAVLISHSLLRILHILHLTFHIFSFE
jgi:hypothetical protein